LKLADDPPLVRESAEHPEQLGCVCAEWHPVTLRRRRWGFHYELQSGSLGTLTPAYDVRVTIAASTAGDTARFTTAPPAEVCALINEVLTPAVGEIAGYVTEAIHRHVSAPGDDPASTADTLASCETNIRLSAGEMIAAIDQVSAFAFTYNDAILTRLEETYRREQEACVRTSAAMRRRVLDAILAGEAVDERRGEI
jgi:hypothetical protein